MAFTTVLLVLPIVFSAFLSVQGQFGQDPIFNHFNPAELGDNLHFGPTSNPTPQIPRKPVLVCQAVNSDQDVIRLTISENNNFQNHFQSSPFSPFGRGFGGILSRLPFGAFGAPQHGPKKLMIDGTIEKAVSTTDILQNGAQDEKRVYLIVTVNGNTAADCIGTGRPLQSRSHASPFQNPLLRLGGFNPFNPFAAQSPYGLHHGLPNTIVRGSSYVIAQDGHKASFHMLLENAPDMRELGGRAVQVVYTPDGRIRSECCCSLNWSDMTLEEFDKYVHHRIIQQQIAQQAAAGGLNAGGFNAGGLNGGTTGTAGTTGGGFL